MEFGLGQVYTSKEIVSNNGTEIETEDKLYASFKLGVRFQKPDGRFVYKIAFTPLYDYNNTNIIPWGGLGFGICF